VRIALLQCELEHRHQAPHLAGALFAHDLRARGHQVDAALVHPSAIDGAAAALGPTDLMLLDSIFPFAIVRALRDRVGAPVLVGGHSAAQHVLRGPADAALIGAARRTVVAAVEAVVGGGEARAGVPGLLFRDGDRLDAGPAALRASPEDELLPYRPDFDFAYFGPPRAPGSNLRIPSIVAELGCVWNRRAGNAVPARAPDVAATPRARQALQRLVDSEGGCTFCVFRGIGRSGHRRARTLDLLLLQARALAGLGAEGVSLQTEDPLPLLPALIRALASDPDTRSIRAIHVRTIPWLLLRRRADLEASIAAARLGGIHLTVGQVGFEAFDDPTLTLFNKGLSAEENVAAATLLSQLTAEHRSVFDGVSGHGLVFLHPWSRVEHALTTVRRVRQSAPFLRALATPASRIELYHEWSPLFWKAQDDGLLVPEPDRFGWSWRHADARLDEAAAASFAIAEQRRGDLPDAYEAALTVVSEEPDLAARKRRYLDLRAAARGAARR
jgi:hypothetical protein